jgi:type IV pilus assembly protein PilA
LDETQLERWRAAIGANAERYLGRFRRIEQAGGWAASWNTAAFLHSTGWFWYRRMFGLAGLNLLAPFLLLFLMVFVGSLVPHSNLDTFAGALVLFYLVVVFVLLPIAADSLYYRRLNARIADPRAKVHAPSAWTLIGALAIGTLWLGIIYIAVAPMYDGFTAGRAKVSEAVLAASGTRNDLTEFFEKERRLPGPAEAARFRTERPSKYVENVVYEPGANRVVVTLREIEPGKRFALHAIVKEGNLTWSCRTIDVETKYLPSTCR